MFGAAIQGELVVKIAPFVLLSVITGVFAAGPAAASPEGSPASAAQGHGACALRTYTVTAVSPQYVDQQQGRFTSRRLAGALVQVQAAPGLTREWLQLSLARHLASMQAGATMKDCPLSAKDVRVEVSSAGDGFSVQLSAKDAKTAEEVLRRALLLKS